MDQVHLHMIQMLEVTKQEYNNRYNRNSLISKYRA